MAVMSFDVEKNKAWLAGKPGARCAVLGGFPANVCHSTRKLEAMPINRSVWKHPENQSLKDLKSGEFSRRASNDLIGSFATSSVHRRRFIRILPHGCHPLQFIL
ncbi:hypothetical protein [Burkholderia ambifaria]|jgi:hypothetical protein|uniref:hypothetical protein n=1 Tax=Burkholderia ambifaria TaxID=152480 RepID=UPI00158ADEB0|nr:hypothetical protein [Burkholderia ambifaria]